MTDAVQRSWWRRARHSLRVRLVLLFLLLAAAMSAVFLGGMAKAFSGGWRGAVEPMIDDYAARLVAEIGTPPSVERAQAIAERLPLVVRIHGPQVNWSSGPLPRHGPAWRGADGQERVAASRTTTDGHRIDFAFSRRAAEDGPRQMAWTILAALLALTAAAYLWVQRMLRPIQDIGAGARRFGAGQFGAPIPVRHARHPDELSALAVTVNQMAVDLQRMLDAKRTLLLAISHELRSPLTRARLNVELLPEGAGTQPARDALLRDLGQMREMITDLLESERLAQPHAALQRAPTEVAALVQEVIAALAATQPRASQVEVHVAASPASLSQVSVDASRLRLLLRNLLDNALRHTPPHAVPPELHVEVSPPGVLVVKVRDHGPGVPPQQLAHLAEAFYRPDASRQRDTGGVGLGLYLVRLVAQAHGGTFSVTNAEPGLVVEVTLPGHTPPPEAADATKK